MLSISDVSDADYYLRTTGSGCGGGGGGEGSGGSAVDYHFAAMAAGEPPGEWLYPYRNDLGVSGEIHAGGQSSEAFRTVLNELRHPVTGEQLGRAPQRFATPEERVEKFKRKHPGATVEQINEAKVRAESHQAHAVHAWDLTFSTQKSISVLHAALQREGRDDEAAEVKAAFRAGIDAAMKMAADEFGVTRRGAAGPDLDGKTTMRHTGVADLQSAIFVHHTSRERDPQLHAHVMVLNRVLCEDGQWRALFASGLLKSKHQLDAVFQRVMETELTRRLGTRFAMRPDGMAREVVGIGEALIDLFSSRTRALTAEAEQLISEWQERNGVKAEDVPALIRWRLQQEANRRTRRAKAKEPPPREEDLKRWDEQVAAEIREGLWAALEAVDEAACRPHPKSEFDPNVTNSLAIAAITDRRASFNRSHLMWEIDRHLPDMLDVPDGQEPQEYILELLDKQTDAAKSGRQVVSLAAPSPVAVPDSLKDPKTGDNVFEPPVGGRYTTRIHLAREDALVARLDDVGAPVLTEESASRVLGGRGLSAEQLAVATSILTSDQRVALVNAAAGTGKSRLMAALSDASSDMWRHGLTGFSASQIAAEVLAREGVHRAHNIAAFLTYRERFKAGRATDADELKFAVPKDATVVIDEASMVSTPQLTDLLRELDEVGVGRVVMIGDTAQVDAVDAGGGFGLLTQTRAPHTLTQVRRFANQWERDASTKLRDGDLSALTQYEARNRIRGGGEPEEVERKAVRAFVDDHLMGDETVLVVGTTAQAARLSSDIRQRLVEAGHVVGDGVDLHDRTVAGVGDLIQTRQNDSSIGVVNREVWQVVATHDEQGTIEARRSERDDAGRRVWGLRLTLPADYVKHHVELAYAATVEAVQGRTTDTGHLLVDDMMGRSRAYPGLTRGRSANTAWVPVVAPPRRHRESDAEYEARIPSPMSAMVRAFEREDHTEAARTVIAAEQERATHLAHLGPQWQQLVAEHRGADHRQLLEQVLGTDQHAVFADLSFDGLLHLMRSAESHGYDVRAAVEAAYGVGREAGTVNLSGARSPASLLYALLDKHLQRDTVKPRQQVARAESYAERTPAGDDEEITYARDVAGVMDQRVATLGELAVVEPPSWAVALLGPAPDDPFHRGVWVEKVGVVAGYREQYGVTSPIDPVGPAPSRAEPERRWAWTRASAALGVDAERDVVAASDGDLALKVLAWRRTEEGMPRNVDDDLHESHQGIAYLRGQIVRARTRGENPAEHVGHLKEMEARVRDLEEVAGARAVEVERTAPVRDAAQESLVELDRRVKRDQTVADRRAAEHAEREAAEREAADDESRIHLAVGERFREQWVRDAPTFGSQRWAELDDEEPAKRASVFTAALQWWRQGSIRDEEALTARLEEHDAAVAPGGVLGQRGLDRVRAGEDEEQVRASEPSSELEVLSEVHRFTGRDLEGEAPEFGSVDYATADEEQRGRAETRAARRWYGSGDDLDERARRADDLDERAGAADISRTIQEQRHPFDTRTHAEVVKARGEEPPARPEPLETEPEPTPEPARPDVSWARTPPEPAERPEPEPEPRDDLAEQVQRAREAMARVEQDVPVVEPVQVPEREDAER